MAQRRITHVLFDMDGLLLGKSVSLFRYGLLHAAPVLENDERLQIGLRCLVSASRLCYRRNIAFRFRSSEIYVVRFANRRLRHDLDTEKFYTEVQEKILASYGKTFDWSLKAKMMGKKALEAGQILVKEIGLAGILTPEDFISQRESMLHSMFPNSQLLPGAERIIRHLHAHKIPIAIATSSHKYHYELKSTNHKELFSLMNHVIVGDDPAVKLGKPAPDIFLVAASRFLDAPTSLENVLVFEDAPTGIAAARNAGMSVVMVPDPNLDPSLCGNADQVLESLLHFEPSYWGLPDFDSICSS